MHWNQCINIFLYLVTFRQQRTKRPQIWNRPILNCSKIYRQLSSIVLTFYRNWTPSIKRKCRWFCREELFYWRRISLVQIALKIRTLNFSECCLLWFYRIRTFSHRLMSLIRKKPFPFFLGCLKCLKAGQICMKIHRKWTILWTTYVRCSARFKIQRWSCSSLKTPSSWRISVIVLSCF